MKRVLVVTTINGVDHQGIASLVQDTEKQDFELVLVGDKKTPRNLGDVQSSRVHFYDLERQLSSHFSSGRNMPVGHYARKNFGYLVAAEMGFDWISETDDDNRLYETFWETQTPNRLIKNSGTSKWVNIYKPFGFEEYWHRGIPIDEVKNANRQEVSSFEFTEKIGCIQGLADGDPDVDAICRILHSPITKFPTSDSFLLQNGHYAPTNSQLTKWETKSTLPLLYLPSTVPWRVSDIWRGLIAQRYFSIAGLKTQFRGGLGFQNRNEHDLLQDFVDEFVVHKSSRLLIEILEAIEIQELTKFMRAVYSSMLDRNIVTRDEISRLESWLEDTSSILNRD